jgi:hypothetical protein
MTMSYADARIEVEGLVERFARNLDFYKRPDYKETPVRTEFIDPFFEALGWDVRNVRGYAEQYKDVVHEDAIKVSGATRAPDYCFRIGGVRKFFLEAKKPSVSVKGDVGPAYQLRRYAWSAKLPLSILTDFEEFAVYDCRQRPKPDDKAGVGRVMYLTFDQYLDRFDDIYGVFAKESVLQGSFDRYVQDTKRKRGTSEVDTEFLKEIEGWREVLARNIALRNPALSVHELNFAVQRTIDRIIFLRMCEDRGIEDYGRLLALTSGPHLYPRLGELYRQADEKYDSDLFDFRADTLTKTLTIDDKVFKPILAGLYYPQSPYEFSVLPAEILGQVYEQFLGKVIRLTPGHRAKVEEKPEVKKAGGVYYTPTYIVDYIVQQTVGQLIEGKTPRQISKLRILDPACGSGSFLLGAYQYLLDYHRQWYEDHDPGKHARGKRPALYQGRHGEWRLTTAEKKRILLNNIYGVDIDRQAVEVTKLSLLLKVLEGENQETLGQQLALWRERALPDLGDNIKCGNSLIGPDYFEAQLLPDDEEIRHINPFDWEAEFPEIMAAGGFDAVIGNPPYVRQETLGDQKKYFQQNYRVYHGIADLYTYFIERGMSLLKPNGVFCYIVANKWLRANYGKPLRRWMKQQRIEEITDFGDLPVFEKATTYPCILRIRKASPRTTFDVTQVKSIDLDLEEYVSEHRYTVNQSALDDGIWSLADERTQMLLAKLRKAGVSLGEYVEGHIYRGVLTGLNRAFVIDIDTQTRLISEDPRSADLIKPFLTGRDIKRYQPPPIRQYLILIPKGWTRTHSGSTREAWEWFQDNYPAVADHLMPFAETAQKRYDKGEYWWELRACGYYDKFEQSKIVVPAIVRSASYSFDRSGFYSNDKTSIIVTDDLYLLGVLNSKIPDLVMHAISSTKRGGYFEYKPMYLEQLPIRTINFDDPADVARHDKMVALVERMLALHKKLAAATIPADKQLYQRQVETTDRQIDTLVYELYGLTEEEIGVVEGLEHE